MKKITTFLLGTATAMAVASGAQAADPIFDIVDPREPVYRCDLTGYIELPGTDICFKVGGFARAFIESRSRHWGGGANDIAPPVVSVGPNVSWGLLQDKHRIVGQGRINFDARTATEYGTVRAHVEWQATNGGGVAQRHAYIQFGNWLFGHTNNTFFHTGSVAPYGAAYLSVGDNTFRLPQVRYTQPLGGGMSVSVALEDSGHAVAGGPLTLTDVFVLGDVPLAAAGLGPVGAVAIRDRHSMPAVAANIKASGAWGEAHLGGVIVRNEVRQWVVDPAWVGPGFAPGGTDNDWGWGANFGVVLNVPTTEGSTFGFNATYTDGANNYNPSVFGTGNPLANVIWGNPGGSAGNPYQNQIVDSVTALSLHGWYRHVFSPTFAGVIGAGWGKVDYGAVGTAVLGDDVLTIGVSESRVYDLFAIAQWMPVAGTTFQLEGRYGKLDWRGRDFDPSVLGVVDDQDAYSVSLQVVRSF